MKKKLDTDRSHFPLGLLFAIVDFLQVLPLTQIIYSERLRQPARASQNQLKTEVVIETAAPMRVIEALHIKLLEFPSRMADLTLYISSSALCLGVVLPKYQLFVLLVLISPL